MVVVRACQKHEVNRFDFSSSTTVYGNNIFPFNEDMMLLPTTNPSDEAKATSEQILKVTAKANKEFGVTLLRYYNPVC